MEQEAADHPVANLYQTPRTLGESIGSYLIHTGLATVVPILLGVGTMEVLIRLVPSFLGSVIVAPYSPVLPVVAFGWGFLIFRRFDGDAAKWVWIPWLALMILVLVQEFSSHNPAWCDGCTAAQYVWFNYFSADLKYGSDTENLGKLFVTAPLVTSAFYSLGATVAARKTRKPY